MRKNLLTILTLLLIAVSQGVWAQGGNVTLAAGTDDATSWSITPNTGVAAGTSVEIAYNGNLKVNSLTAVETYIYNALPNGSFDTNTDVWYGWGSTQSWDATGGIDGSGAVKIEVANAGNIWDAVFAQSLTALAAGKTYLLRYKVRASGTGHVQSLVQQPSDSYPSVGRVYKEVGTDWSTIETVFTVPADGNSYSQLCLQTGADANVTYWIDDVVLGEVKERSVSLTEVEARRQWTLKMPENNVTLQVAYAPAYRVSFTGANFVASEWALATANGTPITSGLVNPGDQVTVINNSNRTLNSIGAVEQYIDNALPNGSFDANTDGWYGWGSDISWDETGGIDGSGAVKIEVANAGNIWDATFAQSLTALEAGKTYMLRFKARSSGAGHVVGLVQQPSDPYPSVGYIVKDVGTNWTTFESVFTVPADGYSYTQFCLQSGFDANTTYWIDDVELGEVKERSVALTEVEAGRQWTMKMPTNNVVIKVDCENGYNANFVAANANSIEAGAAVVSVDGHAATVTDGKLSAVTAGRTVAITAEDGYEFESVTVSESIINLSKLTANYEVQNGEILTGTLAGKYKISIAAGATVRLRDATINGENNKNYNWAGITCLGGATIILLGENTVKGFYEDYAGIQAGPTGTTLTIKGSGSLTASSGYSSAIGSSMGINCGNIVIEGGTINAWGGRGGSCIGSCSYASCGDISITGGTINAQAWGAGQYLGNTGFGACIGSGDLKSSCGNITITNTVNSITATNRLEAPRTIGAGEKSTCGTVTIGGTVYPNGITNNPYTYAPGNTSGNTVSPTTLPDVTLNSTKTVASLPMPDISIRIDYTLLRNIGKNTEFAGIPTEPIVVKKSEGDKYQPTTPLTYQLNDLLLEGAAKNITQAAGIAIHLEKMGDGDTWSQVANFLSTDNYVPGTYRLVATGTGLYKGTLTSATFTIIDEEELASKTYEVSLAEGISDATNWHLSTNAEKAGETVTITYNGSNKVKTVKGKKTGGYVDMTPVEGASNQWTFVMPVGNVEIEVDYCTLAGVTLASNGNGGTVWLTDASFKALTATDKVTEGDRFVLCVDKADDYDFNVSLSTGELETMPFSLEDNERYLTYARENNIAISLNTMVVWVTMPRVETGDLTVTVGFQKQKTFTVLYQPTGTPTEVWCRIGLNNDVTGMRYDVAKMKSDSELGDKTVWSVKASAASDPSKVAFFTSEEAAKNDAAFTSDAVVSQSVDAWTPITGGKYLMIGGNAKTVVAAFVADGSTLPVYDSEAISIDGNVNSTNVRYQLAVCLTDAEGNVTTAGSVMTMSAPATAPEGKTFDKWNVLAGEAPTKIEMTYTAGQSVSIKENMIFRAVWKPGTLTVALDLNGGTGVSTTNFVNYNDVLAIADTPSRTGYAFDSWAVSQSVSQGNELFIKGSPFDLGTPITANMGLKAQWKHVHSYTYYQINSFGDRLAKYQEYNDAMHIAVCGCNTLDLMPHTFDADGRCDCGYQRPEMAGGKATLNISYGQWSGGNYFEKMQELPEEVERNQEVSISAPGYWGSLQFLKWQYSTGGEWYDLTADAYSSFLIPASMDVRALYVNPVTAPQVELSARQYDDQTEVDGQTYTMDNVLYQMNYKLPDGYNFVDAGIRMGDNAGISYYELKERTLTMDAEAKAIGVSVCVATSLLGGGINTFDASATEKIYVECENSVLDEMSAATLAEYMMQSKPVNVEKYPPIYWEAKAQTNAMSGSMATMPPLRFIQKDNGNHYIYGIGYLKYKTPSGDVMTICTDALPTTRDNIPAYTVTKGGESVAGARQMAQTAAATSPRRAPSAEDNFDMRYVFAPETQLTVYVDGVWSSELSDNYGFGDKVTVTAPAVSGRTFAYWKADGQPLSTANPLTLTMNAHTTLHAVYDGSAAPVAGFTSVTRTNDGKISFHAHCDGSVDGAGIIYSTTAMDDALTIGGDGVTQVAAEMLTDATTTLPVSILDGNNSWMLQIAPEDANTVYHARVYTIVGGNTVYSDVRDVKLVDLKSGILRLANLGGFEEGLDAAMTEVKESGDAVSSYALTLAEGSEDYGRVELTVGGVAATQAKKDDLVTVSVTPNKDSSVKDVTVRFAVPSQVDDINVTPGETDGTWTFTMPDANLEVYITYDTTTNGITQIATSTADKGVYYDLSGRRLVKPTKGIYISNGKKIVIK